MAIHEQSVIALSPKSGKRRSFSGPFKRQLVEQTLRSDVSVAGVALANGLNTNLLARWRRDYLIAQAGGNSSALIPVHVVPGLPAKPPVRSQRAEAAGHGEIEVRHGDTAIIIRGTPDQSILGTVLREVLASGSGSAR